ncbi:MAG: GDP-mannose 4,6-dehydratase [Hormoscilla sp. SP12CHS1]|nr:GDP-mannose 4,6-dehydratase [Hormoscilla sp. SP12CHS1]
MRILVTGGAGFVGSHLIDRLMEAGHEVLCLDNFYTGNKCNILKWLDHPYFELLRHDITEPIRLEVDRIYHLACPASPVHYQSNPVKTVKTNVMGTMNMLGLAKRVKARFLLASTSEVYGDPDVHPQTEDYRGHVNPIGIRSCFSADTEVLTSEGWKYFHALSREDRIATLNGERARRRRKIEYHQPVEIISQRYRGKVIHFQNQDCDLLVTPNHKMYAKSRKEPNFEQIRADAPLQWEAAQMLKVAHYQGEERDWFDLSVHLPQQASRASRNRIKMDDWVEFLGYYIAEGTIGIQEGKYQVILAEAGEKYEQMKACVARLPFPNVKLGKQEISIYSQQLYSYLEKLGPSEERYIPRDVMCLSSRQLNIFWTSVRQGEGTGDRYECKSGRLISDVQELLLKLGYAGNIEVQETQSQEKVYQIQVQDGRENPRYGKQAVSEYDGFVYCVNVPNHVIFVRRNGKALFCGNCYDEGKRIAETLSFDYHRQNNVDIRVVRIFNTYGPRMLENDGRVVSNFIAQALKNIPLTVYGDGSQTRSFCYVSDLVEGIIRLMNESHVGPVNIGNPDEYSILELAHKIQAMINPEAEIIFKPLPQDDPRQRQPDITRAKRWLGWEPTIPLAEGLKRTIDDFRDRLS